MGSWQYPKIIPPPPTWNLDFQNLKDAILGHTHIKFCTMIDVVITTLYVFLGVPLFPLSGHISWIQTYHLLSIALFNELRFTDPKQKIQVKVQGNN